MTKNDPLRNRLAEAEASWLVYGQGDSAVELVEAFGAIEIEYAAIRKGCVLFHQPHRATIRLAGADRRDLMNRLFTQELKNLTAGDCLRTLWLNRQGRIDADLRVVELEGETFLDLDRNAAGRTIEGVDRFILAEDVAIEDATGAWRRLALHGPKSGALLESLTGGDLPEPGAVRESSIDGVRAIIDRQDSLGAPGYELLIEADGVASVDRALVGAGESDESLKFRRAGWLAVNIARIEAGWPLYLTDFGTDSIPNELGELLHDRVSFTKGCYLGQEVVARIHSLGKPKRALRSIKFEREVIGEGEEARTLQPATAASVLDAPDGKTIGAVTSSTLSPMLGDAPIAFAQLKSDSADPGAEVHADLGARTISGRVRETLRFL